MTNEYEIAGRSHHAPFRFLCSLPGSTVAAASSMALVGLICVSAAMASGADGRTGGIFPLRHGVYVQKGEDCGSPPNAAIRSYDGQGIGDPHTHACRAKVLSRGGNGYFASQSCIDTGTGPGPRSTERMSLIIPDVSTFTELDEGRKVTYRYCAPERLPTSLRGGPGGR